MFPQLTEPVNAQNPHQIIRFSGKPFEIKSMKCSPDTHIEYLDNKDELKQTSHHLPVVALHGYLGNAFEWQALMKEMSAASIRMISKYQIMQGPILWGFQCIQQNDLSQVSFSNYSNALASMLIEGLGFQRFVLVGHSFGSYVCFMMAHKFPDRVAGIMNIAGVGLRFHWGQDTLKLRLSAFVHQTRTKFAETYKEKSEQKLKSLIRNEREWTPTILVPHEPWKEDYHFGVNPYRPSSTIKLGRYSDVYHFLCALQYQTELASTFQYTRRKLKIPVFVALGSDDGIINRSFILEYCKEKYRGRLKISVKDIINHLRGKIQKHQYNSLQSLQCEEKLRLEPDFLSQIQENSLLQVRGAGHNLHMTQTPMIGRNLVRLVSLCGALEKISTSSSKL